MTLLLAADLGGTKSDLWLFELKDGRREIREQVLGDVGPERQGASCATEFVPIAVARMAPIPGVMAMTEAPAQAALSATIEIELDESLRIVGGRVVPLAELGRR